MKIEDLWLALEKELTASASLEWLIRRASPEQGYPLLVAVEPLTHRRMLLLPVATHSLPPRGEWPTCRGLELLALAIDGTTHLAVRLNDESAADVFAVLTEDVAPRITACHNDKTAVAALLDRLQRWQQFLSAAHVGLSLERERGLWGELNVLWAHMFKPLGGRDAVSAWKAFANAHQDFQFPSGAVEIKTTAAKQPQSVRITSERQLDSTGVGRLFLHVVVVDEREVSPQEGTDGESLPSLIGTLRAALHTDAVAVGLLNDRLLQMGYLDAHAPRYENRRRTVRQEHSFEVQPGFPRLTESELPSGVGDISYALELNACVPFVVDIQEMISTFR
jgi:hypothetical protein